MEPATVADEARRLADRLRSLSDVRLARQFSPGRTAAATALGVAQRLADLSIGIEQRSSEQPPATRDIPAVPDFAVGDVLAVTGNDLVAAANQLPAETAIWRDGDRAALKESLAEAAEICRALRLAL